MTSSKHLSYTANKLNQLGMIYKFFYYKVGKPIITDWEYDKYERFCKKVFEEIGGVPDPFYEQVGYNDKWLKEK